RAKVDELVRDGASAATSPAEVASATDILITMLPNSPDVELVALGSNGIKQGAKAGQLFIDMSTINPIVSQKIAKELEPLGVAMIDAPVSGGEKGAIDGALSIMAGDFAPGFKIDLHSKDLNLIQDAARSVGVPIPTAAFVEQLFAALRVRGRGGLDHSSVVTLFEDLAGVQVRRT